MRQVLEVWMHFLEHFNGVTFWREEHLEAELQVHSNAAGSLGMGFFYYGHWCEEPWLPGMG